MAISTRMSRSPVTPSAQSPSIGARPSSSRPSSVKNAMAASMSCTTMPTLSIRLTVMVSPWRLTHRWRHMPADIRRRYKRGLSLISVVQDLGEELLRALGARRAEELVLFRVLDDAPAVHEDDA